MNDVIGHGSTYVTNPNVNKTYFFITRSAFRPQTERNMTITKTDVSHGRTGNDVLPPCASISLNELMTHCDTWSIVDQRFVHGFSNISQRPTNDLSTSMTDLYAILDEVLQMTSESETMDESPTCSPVLKQ